VDLSVNSFDFQQFPTAFGNLTTLVNLDVSSNAFTGSLPSEMGQLALLEEIRINNNNLSGNLPESISSLEVLRVMALSDNFIGPELPNLTMLSNLRTLNNLPMAFSVRFSPVSSGILDLSSTFIATFPQVNELGKLGS